MKAFTKLTLLSSSLALVLAATACTTDIDADGDEDADSDSDSDGSGGTANTGGGASTGGSDAGGAGGASATVSEALEGNPDYSFFFDAVAKAGLESELEADGITVFAPNNDAFQNLLDDLDVDSLDDLTPGQLKPIVRYHIVSTELDSDALLDFAPGDDKKSSLGGRFDVSALLEVISIDGATIVDADIRGSNGVIHEINEVLLPSITDIVTTDARFTGLKGLVASADGGSGSPNVANTLDDSSSLGVWLFFAPNNAAVTDLGTAPENQALTNALLYHAVPQLSVITRAEALAFTDQSIETEFASHDIIVDGGTEVTVTDEDAATEVATVVESDIYAENGIIHVVDAVLLPD